MGTDVPAPVVRMQNNAIHRKIAIQWINVNKTNHAIRWIVIYLVDSVIHLSNNPGLLVSSGESKCLKVPTKGVEWQNSCYTRQKQCLYKPRVGYM